MTSHNLYYVKLLVAVAFYCGQYRHGLTSVEVKVPD